MAKPPRYTTTVSPQPLPMYDGYVDQSAAVLWVKLAVKKGIEVTINHEALADPTADCWFAVKVGYLGYRPGRRGLDTSDILITNGTVYYLCRRDRGSCAPVMDDTLRATIAEALTKFVGSL